MIFVFPLPVHIEHLQKLLMCISVWLHVCIYTTFIPGAHRDQNRALDPMAPELETTDRN